MTIKSIGVRGDLYSYLLQVGVREPAVLSKLREETAAHPMVNMQISPDQGAFMAMLVRVIGATRCIEVGVYTGYSSTAVALALPEGGKLVACDINEDYTNIAQRFWQEAGVAEKVDLHLAPANDTLDSLIATGKSGTFDFAFIDADKAGYDSYYEKCLELLRPGGLIAVDNVLWGGAVADAGNTEPDTQALRDFNQKRAGDHRVDISMVPLADGISLFRKLEGAQE